MAFVKDKGNARKKDLLEICKFQTGDAENTKKLVMDIEAQIDLARDQNTEFTERLDKYNTEKEEAEQNIGKFEEEIAAKEAEREKSTEDPAPHRAKAEEHRANIEAPHEATRGVAGNT